MLAALEEVWQDHPDGMDDPMRAFALAWKSLRDKYKEIQAIAKQIEDPLADMYEKLTQLELDILEDSSLFQKEEFQELHTQI